MASGSRSKLPPELPRDAHKGTAGRLLCLCGSREMPGAAILVVRAAYRAGAGRVSLALLDEELMSIVPIASPETVMIPLAGARGGLEALPTSPPAPAFHARVIGSGLGATKRAAELLSACLVDGFDGPQVFDADALNLSAGEPERFASVAGPVILTPHAGEARGLLGREVPGDEAGRVAFAQELSERTGATCVLKGAGTVVADATRVFINDSGNPGMATAGSGDVLTGILGAFLASSALHPEDFSVFDAVAAAVHVHGVAGDLVAAEQGQRSLIASDLIDALPAALRRLG